MQNKSQIEFLQAFRGIAALLVVLYHCSNFISPYGKGLGNTLFGAGGTMGVDLFFLISGFIMVHTTSRSVGGVAETGRFLVKRWSRIWPLYAIATLIYAFEHGHGFRYFQSADNVQTFLRSLVFVPSGAYSEGNFPPVYGWPTLGTGWTLNYEAYFYLMFGASMLFGSWRWIALGAWIVLTIFAAPAVVEPSTAYAQMMTNPLVLLFIAGVGIGIVYRSRVRIANEFFARLAMGMTAVFALWQYGSQFRADHGVTMAGISLIPLMLAWCVASKTVSLRMPRALTYLGDMSFSLYLLHPLVVFVYWAHIAGNVIDGQHSPGFPAMLLVVGACIAAAAISHRYVETRLSEKVRDALMRRIPDHHITASGQSKVY